jgi:hypothetical protein
MIGRETLVITELDSTTPDRRKISKMKKPGTATCHMAHEMTI